MRELATKMTNAAKEKMESVGYMLRFLWPAVMAVLAVLLLRELSRIDSSFTRLDTSFQQLNGQVDSVDKQVTRIGETIKRHESDIQDLEDYTQEHNGRIRALEILNGNRGP